MGVFKLGKMTFGSLFKKPETVLYPIQTKPQPEGLKGHIEVDAPACILCGMCDRSCATNCITVDKGARTWSIDRFQCVQCGYCITVCPKKCLFMDPNYAPASTAHTIDSVSIPESEKPKAEAKKKDRTVTEKHEKSAAEDEVETVTSARADATESDKPETSHVDVELEAKIALMDEASAKRVRDALSAHK